MLSDSSVQDISGLCLTWKLRAVINVQKGIQHFLLECSCFICKGLKFVISPQHEPALLPHRMWKGIKASPDILDISAPGCFQDLFSIKEANFCLEKNMLKKERVEQKVWETKKQLNPSLVCLQFCFHYGLYHCHTTDHE